MWGGIRNTCVTLATRLMTRAGAERVNCVRLHTDTNKVKENRILCSKEADTIWATLVPSAKSGMIISKEECDDNFWYRYRMQPLLISHLTATDVVSASN